MTLPNLVRLDGGSYVSTDGRFAIFRQQPQQPEPAGWTVYDLRPPLQLLAGVESAPVRVAFRVRLVDAVTALATYAGSIS